MLSDLCSITVVLFEQDLNGRFELAKDFAAFFASVFIVIGFLGVLTELFLSAKVLRGVATALCSFLPPQCRPFPV